MPRLSAGLLVYRIIEGIPEVLIGHPGARSGPERTTGRGRSPGGNTTTPRIRGWRPGGSSPRRSDWCRRTVRPLRSRRCGSPAARWSRCSRCEADLDLRDAVSNTFTLEWPRGIREVSEARRTGPGGLVRCGGGARKAAERPTATAGSTAATARSPRVGQGSPLLRRICSRQSRRVCPGLLHAHPHRRFLGGRPTVPRRGRSSPSGSAPRRASATRPWRRCPESTSKRRSPRRR